MSEKNYFYVNTVYGLLISLIYFGNEEENIYFLESTIPEKIRNNLKNTVYIEDYKRKYNIRIIRYIKVYFRSRKLLNMISKIKKIYIQDHFEYGQFFLNNVKGEVFLIEDGTKNYNEKILEYEYRRKYKIGTKIKNRILYLSKINYPIYGLSSKIKKIYLTGILPVPDKIKNKVEFINLEKKWESLSYKKKKTILDIFDINISEVEKLKKVEDKILLVTQPLSEDGIISEEEKIKIYREIILKIKSGEIFIKAHPREITDYKEVFKEFNINIVEKNFPIEIFMLLNLNFKEVVTIFSTAVLNFSTYKINFIGTKNYPKLYSKFGEIKLYSEIKEGEKNKIVR